MASAMVRSLMHFQWSFQLVFQVTFVAGQGQTEYMQAWNKLVDLDLPAHCTPAAVWQDRLLQQRLSQAGGGREPLMSA